MTLSATLLAATLGLPALMLAACISARIRERMLAWLWLAPVPGLAAAFVSVDGSPLTLELPLLRVMLGLDLPGAILLGVAATLWIAAGAYTRTYLRGTPHGGRFAEFWLMTLTGSLGVFIAADLASFYTLFALASLAAYGLVLHDGTPRARRASTLYLEFAIAGEVFLLMGFVLLATAMPGDDLLIGHAMAALPGSPWFAATMVLLIAGFGLKAGLVPLHVWLPIAHPAAPMPASAVLSGAIIKAGVIGLIRFMPFDAALPGWGEALATIGLVTAFYGVGAGITQANPKTVLAYSSISQMGLVATVLGMGLAVGDAHAATGVAYLAAHHVLAKGALFLAVGVVASTSSGRLWPALLPAAVLGLGMGGLPLTGGALAKLAVKPALGYGIVGVLASLAAAGTTLLMLHFLRRLVATAAGDRGVVAPTGLTMPWLALAAAAVAAPWALYPIATGDSLAGPLGAAALWSSLWPVALGAVLFVALRRWGQHLPRVPEGDIVVMGEGASRVALIGAEAIEWAERLLRPWPSIGLSLLALTLALGAALAAGR
jgi:formate hydrogenlyase subunit 3/multisubunit Na+/H+ antiporter MnhD subunit